VGLDDHFHVHLQRAQKIQMVPALEEHFLTIARNPFFDFSPGIKALMLQLQHPSQGSGM
jgi:hypothetical protein